uniref:Uncharacterized protein n=1 Tax=Anguilla anguilla TaxID=7936 RepID=A0A0E9WZ90_ANGAN
MNAPVILEYFFGRFHQLLSWFRKPLDQAQLAASCANKLFYCGGAYLFTVSRKQLACICGSLCQSLCCNI